MAQSSGAQAVLAIPAPRQPLSMLSAEQVAQLLWLIRAAEAGFGHRMLAEVWDYAYGSRILELSAKCDPAEAFDLAAETTAFLSARGIDLLAEQDDSTRTALELFGNQFANAGHPPITHTKLEA